MLRKGSSLVWQLAVLTAATVAFLAADGIVSPSAAANSPPKSVPTSPKPTTNWLGINWRQLATSWKRLIPKQHTAVPKLPANLKSPKQASATPKGMPKQPTPRLHQQGQVKQANQAPIAAPRLTAPGSPHLPQMKRARGDLTEAWQYVSAAAQLPAQKKTAALKGISQALIKLGGANPKQAPGAKKGDPVNLAEEHLLKAEKEVLESKTLPLAEKTIVLADINAAMLALKAKTSPKGGKAAAPGR